MIDLHTHSNASDGNLSPSVLVEEASKRAISVLALTDHDNIQGLEEASRAARERGILFVPGIEFEINWKEDAPGEFHLLGLGINKPSPGFIAAVEDMFQRREKRNLEMVKKMNSEGISFSYDDVKAFAGGDSVFRPSVGRPHFAALLVKRKIVKNTDQAFKRYLGKGKPYYIPRIGLEFEKALEVIHESGGIALIAHPMSLYVAWGRLTDLIKNLKERGLDGLEAWHPAAKTSACQRLKELGEKLGLYVSAGSDFHGENIPARKLGFTGGGKKITESLFDEAFLETIRFLASRPLDLK